ncbi:hypothetical protein D7V97_12485 [Corallococcus sp. CA053C]|uniref:hypothetical protein n=1 Tax=Corallococcus sp. CA053C TaxID=2316732 RepID=UPI000EA1A730|nr:hypothetical protein [Corallococcus sp. CA053C]RKH10946.1 hypothetical protein D7V97_12485 [Corallococcus sp. CA053C]
MRGFVVAVMSAAMLMGCGGVEVEQEGPEVEAPQDTTQLWRCGKDYFIDYYADPAHTQWVGSQQCICNEDRISTGVTNTQYRVFVYEYSCSRALPL